MVVYEAGVWVSTRKVWGCCNNIALHRAMGCRIRAYKEMRVVSFAGMGWATGMEHNMLTRQMQFQAQQELGI